jgi:peptidyl-prolyl cis-trans isomerase SurA
VIKSLAGVAAGSLLLVGALSGCGVAGTDFHPGVAAQVGDDTISVSKVNSVVSSYCSALEGQLAAQQQVLPMRYLRGGVAGELALVAAARQFAEETGVEPGSTYDDKVAQVRTAVKDLPEDQQDAVLEVETSAAYVAGVEQSVGEQVLADKGDTAPQPADAVKAGTKEFTRWLSDQDVSIDPQFGVSIESGQAVPEDTSVSFPLGDTAQQGDAPTPDPSYAAGLPDSLRCG